MGGGQVKSVGSFSRTKREGFSGTKICLTWILSVIFEYSATFRLFGTYLNFGEDFLILAPKYQNYVFGEGEGGWGGLGTSGRFRHRCREKIFRSPLAYEQGVGIWFFTKTDEGLWVFLVQSEFSSYKAGGFRWYKMPYIWILALDVENRVFSKSVRGGRWVPQDLRKVSTSVSGKNIPPTPCLWNMQKIEGLAPLRCTFGTDNCCKTISSWPWWSVGNEKPNLIE